MLSHAYQTIKSLRSTGNRATAYSLLQSNPPRSDEDALEAAVCLFVCGDANSTWHVCQTHTWKEGWARNLARALAIMVSNGDPAQALSLARLAADDSRGRYDATAIYLMLLQANGLTDEAHAYIQRQLQDPPAQETLLLTVMAEIAVAAGDWRQAYKLACAVIAADPDDFRALLALSRANDGLGNVHEALGNALRAHQILRGWPQAILQIMRCRNKLGDYYAAIGAYNTLDAAEGYPAELHVELGMGYAGIGDTVRAKAAYEKALALGRPHIKAIESMIKILFNAGDAAELAALEARYPEEIHGNIECLSLLAKATLAQRNLDRASSLLDESLSLAKAYGTGFSMMEWPVPESRIRHDCEQLELLEQRGALNSAGGRAALGLLRRYYAQTGDTGKTFAPQGSEADALRDALGAFHYCPKLPFSGRALGENSYTALEEQYFSSQPRVLVIDNFLSVDALNTLRRYCEEATIWKMPGGRGYLGASLGQGFGQQRVLLEIADQLRQAMPRVIGNQAMIQAWAFKYDQRLQGIGMHADFAKINVNFWITPEDACEDKTTGGMVVYDVPAPTSWTFSDYNTNQPKIQAFLEAHGAKPMRVPYRENRCVLFDSSLFHVTDELHFKPGYQNRRVNVTLLYGKARSVG
jgi:tetratricopeptide (TPR) repeat protein